MTYNQDKTSVEMVGCTLEGFSAEVPICAERRKNRELDIEFELKVVGKLKGTVILDDESDLLFDKYLKSKE